MPLISWKNKSRGNRFSKLVADHLQSPKRGGSLVVETGFPTSLIDLYVRNRGRFRKSAVKRQRGNDSESLPLPSSDSLTDLNNLDNLSSSGSLADSNNSSFCDSDCRRSYERSYEIIEEDVVFVSGAMVTTDDEIKIENGSKTETKMAKLNAVLMVIVKVLFMVVLVLGTKRFTVGITMSAFVLLVLESVEKRLRGRSVPIRRGVDSNRVFDSGFQERKNVRTSEETATATATLVVCSEVVEIEEQIESKQKVRSDKELDGIRSEVLMEISCKSSKRAIMKSKIKKLVPKKLRRSSMGSKHEICCEPIQEESVKSTHDVKVKPLVFSNERSDSKGETLCILKQNQEKIVDLEGVALSSPLSSEIACNDKGSGMDVQQNHGCLILFLIVLVGLIGGRILALVIALSWCLVSKKIQLRNVKFPFS